MSVVLPATTIPTEFKLKPVGRCVGAQLAEAKGEEKFLLPSPFQPEHLLLPVLYIRLSTDALWIKSPVANKNIIEISVQLSLTGDWKIWDTRDWKFFYPVLSPNSLLVYQFFVLKFFKCGGFSGLSPLSSASHSYPFPTGEVIQFDSFAIISP